MRLQVAAEGGLEPGPSMTTDDDGSGGESRGTVRLAELQVLPVSYYMLSYNARHKDRHRLGQPVGITGTYLRVTLTRG